MSNNIVVAIDGYSSCGKSTLAKALAKKLGFIYVDSGAMYRAVALYFLRNDIDSHNHDQIESAITKHILRLMARKYRTKSA
jgi:cytidylate kinase